MRRLTNGIQIGPLRIFWNARNWRTKYHPYWFARNWNDARTFQSGPLEIFWFKKGAR